MANSKMYQILKVMIDQDSKIWGGVGSRNLLLGTLEPKSFDCLVEGTGFTAFDPYNYLTYDKNIKTYGQGLTMNDWLTFQFDWSISQNGSNELVYGFFTVEGAGKHDDGSNCFPQFLGHDASGQNTTFSAEHTSGHIKFSTKLNQDMLDVNRFRIRIDNSVLKFTISNCKVELGQVATDYSPAWEDLIDITSAECQELLTKLG